MKNEIKNTMKNTGRVQLVELNNINDKKLYSYKIVVSLILDKIMSDKYDLFISMTEHVTGQFEKNFAQNLYGGIHILSDLVAESLPDKMPRTTKDGAMPGKEQVLKILNEVIEREKLEDYLTSIENAVFANDSDSFEMLANDIVERRKKKMII